jgi:hypothetical protein
MARIQDEQRSVVPTSWTGPPRLFFSLAIDSDVLIMFYGGMTDRPASWRMPTPKQMDKMAAVGNSPSPKPGLAPDADLPPKYWQAILDDPRAGSRTGPSEGALRLSQVPQHVLRVGCRRCARVLEIQKADAVRLYGPDALWKSVGQRLLNNTCRERTGRHEEDGCWPTFD